MNCKNSWIESVFKSFIFMTALAIVMLCLFLLLVGAMVKMMGSWLDSMCLSHTAKIAPVLYRFGCQSLLVNKTKRHIL